MNAARVPLFHIRIFVPLSIVLLMTASTFAQDTAESRQSPLSCFPLSSPIVQANLMYNTFDKSSKNRHPRSSFQGNLVATRIYDPTAPLHTEKAELWNVAEILNQMGPDQRTIYVPNLTVTQIKEKIITFGDGRTITFSGKLDPPILPGTLRITDQTETFADRQRHALNGTSGGTGAINPFTGEFELNFHSPPADGVPVRCTYFRYQVHETLVSFDEENIHNAVLGLDETLANGGTSFLYDLDGNSVVDEADGDFLVHRVRGYADKNTKKPWLLPSVAHATPALATPPGRPHWYYGTAIQKADRDSLDAFVQANKERPTRLFVADENGMVHAFDAGRFRWGDNPKTAIIENRGHFKWESLSTHTDLSETWHVLLNRYADPPPYFRWQDTGTGETAPDYGSGRETWGFIPPGLVSRLKQGLLDDADHVPIGASPIISDVYFNAAWHTILVCTGGNHTDTLFALDITDPERPLFLWEFTHPDIIRTEVPPALPQIGKTMVKNKDQWVVFLSSGQGLEKNQAPSLFLIETATGALIEQIMLQSGTDYDHDHMDDAEGGIPVGSPALVDSDGNGYVDRSYVCTHNGFLFKVNLPDGIAGSRAISDPCLINTDFTYQDHAGYFHTIPPEHRFQPISAAPAVTVDNGNHDNGKIDYRVRIFFGTGAACPADPDANDSNGPYYVYAYTDHDAKGECRLQKITLDWFREMAPGHHISVSAFTAAGSVYFSTTVPAKASHPQADPGRLYALDKRTGTVIQEKEIGKALASPVVEDEHVFIKSDQTGPDDILVLGGESFNNDALKTPDARVGIQAWKEEW